MRLGILFPVAIFIVAVVFLGWFLSAATRLRAARNEKSTILMIIIAIVALAGVQFGWW